MSLRHVFSPSGGLAYHLIARRRTRTLWRPFCAVVKEWLSSWLSERDQELIVFGPSAGWTLPLADFKRFSKITLVEPDPLARWLLARRLVKAGVSRDRLRFNARADLLPWFAKDTSEFKNFLAQSPDAAILFANVLGQIGLHLSAEQKANAIGARESFTRALRGRRWASYHDLFSGSAQGQKSLPTEFISYDGLTRLAETVFSEGTVVDHETSWLSEGQETRLAPWPLTEKSLHIIGFVQNGRSQIAD